MASIFDEIGKIGLDGKPVTFFDAMQGRGLPQYSSNPFNVPTPTGINYNNLTKQLAEKPVANNLAGNENFNLMNTFRNMFGMPTQNQRMVDGQKITEVDRNMISNPNMTDQDIENELAESGMNPMMLQTLMEGLLSQSQQPPMQVMPMQQAVRGNPIQTTDLSRFYGGLL